ncbi:unnamed protein product [Mytilus coruscus]|uniref:B box-type domain-containing protein n=1 Tax=Mytilus coruscus TaxID=42192 RepID=A0A6J8DGE7_MYTCO|nr:unnamed protein product [Mytilus coruscus]
MATSVLFVLGLFVSGLNGCKENVCLKKEIVNRTLILYCRVYELGLSIEFHHPKGVVFGDCPAPIRKKNSKLAFRCDNNIIQNLKTNITTLTVEDIDKYNVSGEWICTHGSYPDAITIPVYELHNVQSSKDDSCKTQTTAGLMGFFIFTTLVSVVFNGVLLWKRRTRRAEEEACDTCDTLLTCTICTMCEKLYCGICFPVHLKYYPYHTMCRIEHFFTCKDVVYCKNCSEKTATNVCKECRRVLCRFCGNTHKCNRGKLKELNLELRRVRSKTKQCNADEIEHIETCEISTDVRICGMAFISDCRIVVGDNNNHKLVIFKGKNLEFVHDLDYEPRGMAPVTGNEIAVTFADQYKIHIYNITNKDAELTRLINFKEEKYLEKLKPFSISYDKNRFVVEAGEGEDGCIVLLDDEGAWLKTIHIKNNLVHFCGHTIRMALDMVRGGDTLNDGHIFISAMSRKSVSCIDLKGNEIWTIPLTDPRGIVVIQEETKSKKNIIVASKACSAIFRLNRNDRKDDVLLAKGDVIYPRYIAYHAENSLLCVHVTTDTHEQQLLLYSYHDIVNVSYHDERKD